MGSVKCQNEILGRRRRTCCAFGGRQRKLCMFGKIWSEIVLKGGDLSMVLCSLHPVGWRKNGSRHSSERLQELKQGDVTVKLVT